MADTTNEDLIAWLRQCGTNPRYQVAADRLAELVQENERCKRAYLYQAERAEFAEVRAGKLEREIENAWMEDMLYPHA